MKYFLAVITTIIVFLCAHAVLLIPFMSSDDIILHVLSFIMVLAIQISILAVYFDNKMNKILEKKNK